MGRREARLVIRFTRLRDEGIDLKRPRRRKNQKKKHEKPKEFKDGPLTLTANELITRPNGDCNEDFVSSPVIYSSYEEYLASDLWKHIRTEIRKRDKGKCRICRARGRDVHHLSYDKKVMEGRRLDLLVLLCRPCHKRIEFTRKGEKRTVDQAAHEYRRLASKPRKRRKKKRKGKRAVTAIRPAAQSA